MRKLAGFTLATLCLAAAPLAAQTPAPQDAPAQKRPLDFVTGILFLCTPDYMERWTIGVCDTLTKEAVERAKSGKVPFGLLVPSADPEQGKKVGQAAGFDSTHALFLNVRIERLKRVEKGWAVILRGSGRALPQPGDAPNVPRNAFFVQQATLDEGSSTRLVTNSGIKLIGYFFEYYTTPLPPPPPPRPRVKWKMPGEK